MRPLTRNDRSYSSASYRLRARNAATFSHALAISSKVTLSSGRVTSAAKARHCFAFCLYSSTLRIVLDLGHPRTGWLFLFEPGSFRYSDAEPKELRASTSSDGDDDDGGTGTRLCVAALVNVERSQIVVACLTRRSGARLSEAASSDHRRFPCWCCARHRRAVDRSSAVGAAGSAIHRREPARRWQQHRRRNRR